MDRFEFPKFDLTPCPVLTDGTTRRYPIAIIGAGPVGLAAAVDLSMRGVPVLVLDAKRLSEGSRAICWAKRTLEVCDRLGVGAKLVAKGVTWNRGTVYLGDREIYEFNLLPELDHQWPAFINLQQY